MCTHWVKILGLYPYTEYEIINKNMNHNIKLVVIIVVT